MDQQRTSGMARVLSIGAVMMTFLLLLATAAFVWAEHWLTPGSRWFQDGQAVFVAGSIGTEFIPLPVLEILPELDPERFPAPQLDAETHALRGGWIEKYGFLERRGTDEPTIPPSVPELSALLKSDPTLATLPGGVHLVPFPALQPGSFSGGLRRSHLRRLPLGSAPRPPSRLQAGLRCRQHWA